MYTVASALYSNYDKLGFFTEIHYFWDSVDELQAGLEKAKFAYGYSYVRITV